jgi:hypothetical protein
MVGMVAGQFRALAAVKAAGPGRGRGTHCQAHRVRQRLGRERRPPQLREGFNGVFGESAAAAGPWVAARTMRKMKSSVLPPPPKTLTPRRTRHGALVVFRAHANDEPV